MVWSDQSSFPFYVIDNNGNIILTINETGLHLHGTNGDMDATVSGGTPEIRVSNPAHTQSAFFNFPLIGSEYTFGINGQNYTSVVMPGLPTQLKGRMWFLKDNITMGNVTNDGLTKTIGGNIQITPNALFAQTLDANSILQGARLAANSTEIALIGVVNGTGLDGCKVAINVSGFTFRSSNSLINDLKWTPTDGFIHVVNHDWTNCPLFNGWTNASGYDPLQAKWTPDGRVVMRGVIASGTTTDFVQIASVPFSDWIPAGGVNNFLNPAILGSPQGIVFLAGNGVLSCVGVTGNVQIGFSGVSYSLI